MTDDARPEGVTEVVEAQRPQRGSLEGGSVALRARGPVEVAADDAAEDEVVLVGEVLALTEARRASATLRPMRRGI